jgi:Icc protein
MTVLLAQLTDTHVLDPASDEPRYVDNNARLVEAVDSLNTETMTPDAVLATGDLANWGNQPEYDRLIEIMDELNAPLLPLPGNHDDRDRLRASFPSVPWDDTRHASWTTTIGGVFILGLDSTIPGEPGAEFDSDREKWLISRLAEAESSGAEQVVLALHHPPFVTGISWMDNAGFLGLDRLESVLEESTVCRVVCGHLHRPISSAVAGIPTQVGISTIQHVALDLNHDAPITLINDPAAYMLHHFTGASWVTHTRYVATGETPYKPYWA